jgi:hypothetical protein
MTSCAEATFFLQNCPGDWLLTSVRGGKTLRAS